MSGGIEVVGIEKLKPLLDKQEVLAAVRDALILQSAGKVRSPLPGQLLFEKPHGDCHIKYGHVEGSSTFAIKVATGFYENPAKGLPANHGLVMVWDAATGAPRVLLNDEGWLTAWRTAAATAIAAKALAPAQMSRVGIVGTGLQASLAVEWLVETLGDQAFVIWGRDPAKAMSLADQHTATGRTVSSVKRIEDLLHTCNVIVTATPSKSALFSGDAVRAGTHVVGIGADSPGKQELPSELFARASCILTDDSNQCLDHGDYGCAVRAGVVGKGRDIMLGEVLAERVRIDRKADDTTIADLTGIAAEDIAIAGLFCEKLAA